MAGEDLAKVEVASQQALRDWLPANHAQSEHMVGHLQESGTG